MRYLPIAFLIALLLACGTPSAALPTIQPDSRPTLATTAPAPVTVAPVTSTPETLATIAPTRAPIIVPTLAGVRATGSDCPADHPVKGNIVDRGATKGDQIYHVPGSGSYAATKPERCFADVAEAELAGFRAPK